jgi:exopolysaccharide production protein ExoQ
MIAKSARATASEPIYAILTTRTRPATWWEQVIVTLWVLCTFIVFPGNELILYPCALAFLVLFAVYWDTTLPLAIRAWLLLLVPVLGTLSAGWSPEPARAARGGAMMILHFLIMVTIAARLTRQQIVRAVFFAGVIAIGFAAPLINTFDQGGPYGSKNIFAIRMLICVIASLAIAFEAKEHVLLRLFAIPVAVVAFVFMIIADSATALVFSIVGILVMIGLWMVWQPVARVRHLRTFVLLLLAAVVSAITIALLAMPSNTLVDDFLAALGKDSTLTNRTIIWEAGNRAADENPWLGLGFEGFWRDETGAAQTLNELDHKAFGTKLSFHNTYIEVRVALGWVGFVCLVTALTWSYVRTVLGWFRSQGMASSFFLTIATVILVSTFTESYMLGTFDTFVLLFYTAPLTALAEKYHAGERQYVRLRPNPD